MHAPHREVSYLDSVHERLERDGDTVLTTPERHFLALEELENHLMTGGTAEYLLTATREKMEIVLSALAAIGADRTRELTEAAASAIRESTRGGTRLDSGGSTSRSKLLGQFVSQLEDYPDHLRSLRDAYAAAKESEFLGPKTELELWLSRRQRGAETAPRRVTVVVSPEAERQRDALVSSRSCPQCGYPSPDYRRTCKACGFPHGVKERHDA